MAAFSTTDSNDHDNIIDTNKDNTKHKDKNLIVNCVQSRAPLGLENLTKSGVAKALTLYGFDFSNNIHLVELFKFLFHDQTIKDLTIISFGCNSGYLKIFCERILQHARCNIESLFLMIQKFVDADHNKELNHLCFSNLVSMQPKLRHLVINIENMGIEYILPLICALNNNTSLKSLGIRNFNSEYNYSIESGIITDALTKMLSNNHTLEEFCYSYHMDGKDIIKIFELPDIRIKKLFLFSSYIKKKHLKKIANLLKNNTSLISMDIDTEDFCSKEYKKAYGSIDNILAENKKNYMLNQPLLTRLIDQL